VSAPQLTREECIREARCRARPRPLGDARDYAAGLLTGDRLAAYERVIALDEARKAAAGQQADAA
jgi:hypothetical protein